MRIQTITALTATLVTTLACGGALSDGQPIAATSTWACTGCEIYDVDVQGGRAYLADNERGLVILDVSDPAMPKELGLLAGGKPIAIRVDGTTAYVGDFSRGLVVIDVSNPAAPVELSVTKASSPYYVEKKGNFLFLPGQVWDVTDPKAPAKAGKIPDKGGNGAWLEGDTLYVGASTDGFKIVDVSNPAEPVLLGEIASDYAKDVALYGTIAYVAEWNPHTVGIFDVSNPASPARLGSLDLGGNNPGGVAVSGSTLFVASGRGGLVTFDLADPKAPVAKAEVKTGKHDAYKVITTGQGVFAADKKNGLILTPAP